jgi:hypothetical protein
MSKKQKRDRRAPLPTRTGTSNPPQAAGDRGPEFQAALPAAEALHARELLAGRHSKAAVEVAKELHKRYATPESEILLIEAYESRIRDLLKHGMSREAKALLNLVGERFPSARNRLEEIQFEVRTGEGDLDELVRPLQDPDLAPVVREKIETAIRQRVYDLPALAKTSSLPGTHPLREGAAVLFTALQAVTRGPVEDAVLLLPQLSRRSPLSSWKALVNAIASFYRGNDDACKKWLGTITPDSVPVRLIPAMQAMLDAAPGSAFSPAALKLIGSVGLGRELLRPALACLQQAMVTGRKNQILNSAREAITLCRQYCPDLSEKLRQRIAVRCMLLGLAVEPVRAAIGTPRQDAYFYRLMARGLEGAKTYEGRAHSVFVWEDFRQQALKEKWFGENSPEDGVLSLHMAQIVERIPSDLVEEMLEDLMLEGSLGASYPPVRDGSLPRAKLLSPDTLYERACRADPHSEAFQKWLNWAKKQRDWRAPDRVAELWRQSQRQDVAPLLWLMESAERRGAYQKSLKFLEEAEQLDRVNPEVHEAKLRLLVASVLRHFRERKTHLATQGIGRIEALPGTLDGALAPFISALRRVCAALNHDLEAARRHDGELEIRLGNPAAAYVLQRGVLDAAVLAPADAFLRPVEITPEDGVSLLVGLAKACTLGDLVGVPLAIPKKWEDRLSAWFTHSALSLDAAQVLVLGEAAMRSQSPKLAFAISAAGLARGGADARVMFLRARALPPWASERRYHCLFAALELARRERNTDLAGRLLDELQAHPRNMFGLEDSMGEIAREDYALEPELLNEVLEEERAEKQFPVSGRSALPRYVREHETDECDSARPRRGEREFDENEDLAQLQDLLENMPPEVAREVNKAIALGASPEQILRQLSSREDSPERESRRSPRKRDALGRDLQDLIDKLPPELAVEISRCVAQGVSPEQILEEMEQILFGRALPDKGPQRRPQKKTPFNPPPEQRCLF